MHSASLFSGRRQKEEGRQDHGSRYGLFFRSDNQVRIYIILFLLFFVALYSLLFSGKMYEALTTQQDLVISPGTLRAGAKDFEISQQTFSSTSADPWLEIGVPRGKYHEVVIDVESLSVDQTLCAVYYALSDNGGFVPENYVAAALTTGTVSVALPDAEIDRLRLDLTNEPNVGIRLGQVHLVPNGKIVTFNASLLALAGVVGFLLLLVPVSGLISKLVLRVSGVSDHQGSKKASREHIGLAASLPVLGRFANRFGDKIKSAMDYFRKRPKSVLVLLMSASIIVCFWKYLSGRKYFSFYDLGSDTVWAYQPYWFSIADDIAAGRVAQWTLNFGLGTSTLNHIVWCMDPFLWPTLLTYLLAGFQAAQVTIAWMHCLKLLLTAMICYDLLSEFSLGNAAKVIASYAYGFCGFLVLWGQHYMFSTYFLVSSLILLFLERSIKQEAIGRHHLYLVLAVAWFVGRTYYFAYMSLLAMGIYTLFRLFYVYSLKDFKKLVLSGIRVLLSVILGFMLASVIFLPQIREIMTVSDRIATNSSLSQYLGWVSESHLITIISRLFSNNLLGTNAFYGYTNYYEAEQLFLTSFLPLFFILYVFWGLDDGWQRFAVRFIGVAILCLLPLCPATGYVLNGFVSFTGRYTFVFMPVYAYIMAKALDGIFAHKKALFPIVLACLIYTCFISAMYRRFGFSRLICFVILAELFCLIALIFIYNLFPRIEILARLLIAMVILLNVFGDTWITTNHRTVLDDVFTRGSLAESTDSVKEIGAYLSEKDDSLFRIEKTYTNYSQFNDAMIEDYYGVSYYNAVVNHRIKDFFKNCWRNVIHDSDGLYIRYEYDYNNSKMAGLLGIKYIISDAPLDASPGYRYVDAVSNRCVYENTDFKGFGRFYTAAMRYDAFQALSEEERTEALQKYLITDEIIEQSEATADIRIKRPDTDDHIVIEANSDGDGFVFVPIPYEDGWTATVDGAPEDVHRVDYGFIAVPVQKGSHSVVLRYRIPLLKEGAVISAIGLVILGLIFGIRKTIRRRKRLSAIVSGN